MKKPHFHLAGIPVRVEPLFFLVLAFLGFGQPAPYVASWILIAAVSVLVHELGHAVAFRIYGLHPHITLMGFGGVTAAVGGDLGRFGPTRRIVTSLAGPFAALTLLGIPAWLYAQGNGFDPWAALVIDPRVVRNPQEVICSQIIFINIGWSLVNLLPVLPLDGGNVMASLIEMVRPRGARRVANVISMVLAGILGVLCLAGGYEFGLIMVAFLVVANGMELGRSGGDDVDRDLAEAAGLLLRYEPFAAEQAARAALAGKPSAPARAWALELVAWSRLAQGDVAGAAHQAATMGPGPGPSASLRGAIALAQGDVAGGVAMLAWAFANGHANAAKPFGAIAAAQAQQVDAVAAELVRIGPRGVAGARQLARELARVGHRAEAARVEELLGRADLSTLPPGWG